MAAIDITAERTSNSSAPRLLTRVGAPFRHLFSLAAERRAIARLSRMTTRQLDDMGFDAAAIHGAVEGSWDEVDPGRYHHP